MQYARAPLLGTADNLFIKQNIIKDSPPPTKTAIPIMINNVWLEKAKCFVDKVQYRRDPYLASNDGQSNAASNYDQRYWGCVAEEAVCFFFRCNNFICSDPDYTVKYRGDWEPDLIVDSMYPISVKSQVYQSTRAFGASWVFENKDKSLVLGTHTPFLVICVLFNNVQTIAYVTVMISADDIVQHQLLRDLKKADMKQIATKKALYMQDLVNTKWLL
jgi:hypothetical protein